MNIEILAARLASLVPEMAHDCPTNNAEKIKQEIIEEFERGRRVNAQLPKVYAAEEYAPKGMTLADLEAYLSGVKKQV